MSAEWIESLQRRAHALVVTQGDEIAEALVAHDEGCMVYVAAEAIVSLCGYTSVSFMTLWGTDKLDHQHSWMSHGC